MTFVRIVKFWLECVSVPYGFHIGIGIVWDCYTGIVLFSKYFLFEF